MTVDVRVRTRILVTERSRQKCAESGAAENGAGLPSTVRGSGKSRFDSQPSNPHLSTDLLQGR